MARKTPLFIPFTSQNGNMLDWYYQSYEVFLQFHANHRSMPSPMVYWRDDSPFKAGMRIIEFQRGRSAAHFILEDDATKQRYSMFGHVLCDMLKIASMSNGLIDGTWGFIKRGANYSLEYRGS